MNNLSYPKSPPVISSNDTGDNKIKGKIRSRYMRVASLVAQGLPVRLISEQTGLSESRIYHLLSDKDSLVNRELNRLSNEMFLIHQRLLADLLFKTLKVLNEMLSSSNMKDRRQAISSVLKLFLAKIGTPMTGNFFGVQPQKQQRELSPITAMVLERSRGKGLSGDR